MDKQHVLDVIMPVVTKLYAMTTLLLTSNDVVSQEAMLIMDIHKQLHYVIRPLLKLEQELLEDLSTSLSTSFYHTSDEDSLDPCPLHIPHTDSQARAGDVPDSGGSNHQGEVPPPGSPTHILHESESLCV